MTDQPNTPPQHPWAGSGNAQPTGWGAERPPTDQPVASQPLNPRTDPETGLVWPTDRCMVTVGFYVLGRCGARAVEVCPQCGRGMCSDHAIAGPEGLLCLTCETEQRSYQPPSALDPSWAARYRRVYRGDASRRFGDDRLYWSFNRYDTYYTSPGMGSGIDGSNDFDDNDMFDS